MSTTAPAPSTGAKSEELTRILESAQRLGVEMDEGEALQWLTAISASHAAGADVVVDVRDGVFGHRVTMLDFSPDDLAHFRRVGHIVEIPDSADVETALALSGSAAQSKVQRFPGDCDYFERVNIKAPTREAACKRLSEVMRSKALDKFKGADYQFLFCRWGTAREDMLRDGRLFKLGASLTWSPAEVQAGQFEAILPAPGQAGAAAPANDEPQAGRSVVIPWSYGEADPGWCKLDWIVADLTRGQLSNASNVLDVTWEAPDGSITPLDGFIDPYFQEVYLDAESIPVFTKLVKHISADALDDYVAQLRHEVHKWACEKHNYGKVAKRLYNIFRLTGRYAAAAYIRELFDEPTTYLYQVWSLLGTIEDVGADGPKMEVGPVLAQMDTLIKAVVDLCDGPVEKEIVTNLLELKEHLAGHAQLGAHYGEVVQAAQDTVIVLLNQYFRERLYAVPEVAAYLDEMLVQAENGCP